MNLFTTFSDGGAADVMVACDVFRDIYNGPQIRALSAVSVAS